MNWVPSPTPKTRTRSFSATPSPDSRMSQKPRHRRSTRKSGRSSTIAIAVRLRSSTSAWTICTRSRKAYSNTRRSPGMRSWRCSRAFRRCARRTKSRRPNADLGQACHRPDVHALSARSRRSLSRGDRSRVSGGASCPGSDRLQFGQEPGGRAIALPRIHFAKISHNELCAVGGSELLDPILWQFPIAGKQRVCQYLRVNTFRDTRAKKRLGHRHFGGRPVAPVFLEQYHDEIENRGLDVAAVTAPAIRKQIRYEFVRRPIIKSDVARALPKNLVNGRPENGFRHRAR